MFSNQSRKKSRGDWEASRSRLGMGEELAPGEGQTVVVAVSGGKQRTFQAPGTAGAHTWVRAAPPASHCICFGGFSFIFFRSPSFSCGMLGADCGILLNVVTSASLPRWRSQQEGNAFIVT